MVNNWYISIVIMWVTYSFNKPGEGNLYSDGDKKQSNSTANPLAPPKSAARDHVTRRVWRREEGEEKMRMEEGMELEE